MEHAVRAIVVYDGDKFEKWNVQSSATQNCTVFILLISLVYERVFRYIIFVQDSEEHYTKAYTTYSGRANKYWINVDNFVNEIVFL